MLLLLLFIHPANQHTIHVGYFMKIIVLYLKYLK